MVKAKQPESQPSAEEPQQEDFSRAHPLMRHTTQAQEMLEKAMARKEADDFKIKEIEEWKLCVNSVASSPNGRMLLRSMLQFSGVLEAPQVNNPNRMVTNTIKGSFYLTWVRPFLNPEVRRELE
jgi:hypothetical protein